MLYRLVYDSVERIKGSPFDVHIGSLIVPFGLEYQCGLITVIPCQAVEVAMMKVTSPECDPDTNPDPNPNTNPNTNPDPGPNPDLSVNPNTNITITPTLT